MLIGKIEIQLSSKFTLFICMCVNMCECMPLACMCLRGQEEALDILELGLQVVVSWLTSVLGTELGSS